MKTWLASFLWCLFLLPAMAARESITLDLEVGQNARQALVFPAPASAKDAKASVPLVFCFHGHGGNATQASRSFGMHEAWPEAVVIYPQGLPTPGQLTDPEGKRNGWQGAPGLQEDRDLKFFTRCWRNFASATPSMPNGFSSWVTRMAVVSPICCGPHGVRKSLP